MNTIVMLAGAETTPENPQGQKRDRTAVQCRSVWGTRETKYPHGQKHHAFRQALDGACGHNTGNPRMGKTKLRRHSVQASTPEAPRSGRAGILQGSGSGVLAWRHAVPIDPRPLGASAPRRPSRGLGRGDDDRTSVNVKLM